MEFPDTSFYILVAIFIAITAIISSNITSSTGSRAVSRGMTLLLTVLSLGGLLILIGELISAIFRSFEAVTLGDVVKYGVLTQFVGLFTIALVMII